MNILPINSINSNNNETSFKKIKIVGYAPKEIKNMIYKSALNQTDEDLLALTSSVRVSKYDFNHAIGTHLYRFKIVKKPEGWLQKFLCRLGIAKGVYITNDYHSDNGTKIALNDAHIKSILKKLND